MECEHIYDEEKGDPDSGLAPGTRWADIPDSWLARYAALRKVFLS